MLEGTFFRIYGGDTFQIVFGDPPQNLKPIARIIGRRENWGENLLVPTTNHDTIGDFWVVQLECFRPIIDLQGKTVFSFWQF